MKKISITRIVLHKVKCANCDKELGYIDTEPVIDDRELGTIATNMYCPKCATDETIKLYVSEWNIKRISK